MGNPGWAMAAMGLALAAAAPGQDAAAPKVFGGARTDEVYRIRLDRDDLILESVMAAIQQYDIQDGAVLTAVGSVQQCTYHGVTSLAAVAKDRYTTVKGPMEILNINGIIAAGEPHLHLTLANHKGAFGGHIENGCRVLYRAELTIAKFAGRPLARKLNREGVPLLQEK